ncbi:MAG: BBP7 family outer membrane beta-barrel protein [Planctomycetota bacterium]
MMKRFLNISLAIVLAGFSGLWTANANAQGLLGHGLMGGGLMGGGCSTGACPPSIGGGMGIGNLGHSLVGGLTQIGAGLGSGVKGHVQNFAAQHPNLAGATLGWPGRYPASMAHPPFAGGGAPPQDVWQSGVGYQNLGVAGCSGPHEYDFFFDTVYFRRAKGRNVGLMSDGIRGLADPNLVLQTDGIDYNFEPGYRIGGRFQLSAVHSIEAEYLGGVDWDDRITRFSATNELYSVFSDFGNLPFGGFEDSDQASSTTLSMDSELDSAEFNYRKSWSTQDFMTSGSWLCGIRYLRVDESLQHRIDVTPHFDPINLINRAAEFTQYDIRANNSLFGPQIGAELLRCLSCGISLGMEGKLGVFANRTSLRSTLQATTLGTLVENDQSRELAFMGDGSAFLLWKFHPLWSLRAGYEVLWVGNVATAAANYNSAPFLNTDPLGNPVAVGTTRAVNTKDDDNLLYNGFFVGVEFGW